MTDALTLVLLLAQEEPRNTGPDFGKASPFGLIVIVLLLLATFGLVWSMNRQLKKVPESFDEPRPAPGEATGQGVDERPGGTELDDGGTGREPGG